MPLIAWAFLATLIFAATEFHANPMGLVQFLGDTDDATRLYQVREFMSGAPWFDLRLPRLGAPEPLISHWSRLVDAPIAAIIKVARLFAAPNDAELTARLIWPLSLFCALAWLLARDAAGCSRSHSVTAAWIALGLTVYAHSGVIQFAPGRIDHHNVMIVAAVGGLLLLAESFGRRRAAIPAGILLGVGTAAGYEAMALSYGGLILAGLYALWSSRGIASVAATAASLLATLSLALIITTPPSAVLHPSCDALGINLIILTAGGTGGLIAAHRLSGRLSRIYRVAAATALAAVGLAAAILVNPDCAAGPFAGVDPLAVQHWLSLVQEMQSLPSYLQTNTLVALQFAIAAVLGLAAAGFVYRRDSNDRNLIQLFVVVLATALACWQIKFTPYASFLAIPALANLIAGLDRRAGLSPLATRLAGFLALNQHTHLAVLLVAARLAALPAAGASSDLNQTSAAAKNAKLCFATSAITPLRQLAPGLIVTHVDFGPHIVALTEHRVLAGPYHRLDKAILQNLAIMDATPSVAEQQLRALRADYVVQCEGSARHSRSGPGLDAQLAHGSLPAYLEPVRLDAPTPYKVWRIKDSGE